ncbi:hypothetical protein UlMin_044701 [Ulmus minor]
MYEEGSCSFDPNTMAEGEGGFISMEDQPLTYQNHQQDAAMDVELQQQLAYNMDNSAFNSSSHLVSFEHSNWDNNVQQMQQQQLPAPDLLNLFHSSLLPNSSITFNKPPNSLPFLGDHLPGSVDSSSATSPVLYDPLFHLNLPPQPPLFKDLFQSLPNGYTFPPSRHGSLFGSCGGEREGSAGLYQDGEGLQFENGVLEFTRDIARIDRGRDGRGTKHFATERHRRVQMTDKYGTLRSLVPNPTKNDRASVVGDAIEYIRELRRTVQELKLLVEKKRRSRERSKRQKSEEDASGDVESCNIKADPDQSYIRSSWLQRKSKDTEVDVRIIDDEVTIKLVQRKKINLLLTASKVLDELQLDLRHVAGGHVGDTFSFLFNTKIYEGSCLYASAIANKLMEVLDRQYATIAPTSSCY